ncbi:MAG: type II toxin-antitoxin system HicB family antitoxin [Geminicoccaceae bacterium]
MRYAVVIRRDQGGYRAEVPDLPGCVATGASEEDAKKEIAAALRRHLAKLERDGQKAPEPSLTVDYIEA